MTVTRPQALFRLTRRNLMALMRNKAALLLPLIPIVIAILMHVVLIDGYLMHYLKSVIEPFAAVTDEKCRVFLNNRFSTNFIAIVTIAYALVGGVQAVEDKQNGAAESIMTLPIPRCTVNASYVFSAVVFGAFFGLISFAMSMSFMALTGHFYVTAAEAAIAIATILLIAITAGLIASIIACFVKTSTIFNALIAVVALIFAFSVGAIVPIAVLPDEVGRLFSLFVFSEEATILRNTTFLNDAINLLGRSNSDIFPILSRAFDGEISINGATRSNGGIVLSIFINILIFAFIYALEAFAFTVLKSRCYKR